MRLNRFRTIFRDQFCWCALIVLACSRPSTVSAEFIHLKNGTVIQGQLQVLNSLSDQAVGSAELKRAKDKEPLPHSIALVDVGWQHVYFPLLQRIATASEFETNRGGPHPVMFTPECPNRQSGRLTVTAFGTAAVADPFSEFGWRRMTIETQNKSINVIQAITQITPDHVQVESLNCHWNLGLALKSIPLETLDALLKKQLKWDDPLSRFTLVRFYAQAEYYPQAFAELAAITRDFPDKKESLEQFQRELMNYFGAEILRRLERRKRAGQHVLAETFAKELINQPLDGLVLKAVQQNLRDYDQSRQTIERAKSLLADWQSKLNNSELEDRVQLRCSTICDQLDVETLARLDPFLKAEVDDQYEPAQRLGLACSGWILGAANAIPDLDQSLRVWDARDSVLEFLRSDDPSLDIELIQKLRAAENVSPSTVLDLTAQLPPIFETTDIEPGTSHEIEASSTGQIKYSVMLPTEYSPHHSYPLVVALRPSDRSTHETLSVWAGGEDDPDLGCQRGYIVIAPDFANLNTADSMQDTTVRDCVLQSLIDARKRFAVDSDRVFLVGHGTGADSAYDIGTAHADEFAGVLPLGGNAAKSFAHCLENASHTAWYVVGKGYDSNGAGEIASHAIFDKVLRHGLKYDFMLVEYAGRSGENLTDEIPKLFDWMDSHVRPEHPRNFKVRSLRKTDNRFFWVTATGLPRNRILATSTSATRKITPMEIDVRIFENNTIYLKSQTENYTLRLTPELVDFEKRLMVRIGDHVEFNGFVKPDVTAVLEELRNRGDRKRLPLAVLSP